MFTHANSLKMVLLLFYLKMRKKKESQIPISVSCCFLGIAVYCGRHTEQGKKATLTCVGRKTALIKSMKEL